MFGLSKLRSLLCLPGKRDTHRACSAAHLAPAAGAVHHEKRPPFRFVGLLGKYFLLSVAVVSSGKVDEVDETLHVESKPGSKCEPEPGSGS